MPTRTAGKAIGPHRRASRRRRVRFRRAACLAAALGALLSAAYAMPCLLVVRALTLPKRLPLSSSPEDRGRAYEDVSFTSCGDHLTLRGWWIPGSGAEAVIMVHGKDSVRDDPSLGFLDLAAGLAAAGYNALTFDLRGHGESQVGRLTLGVHETRDVLGAIDHVRGRGIPLGKIGLLGFSMGGAAALHASVLAPGVGATVADGVWLDLRVLLAAQIPRSSHLPSLYVPGVIFAERLLYGVEISGESPAADVAALAARGHPLFLVHESDDQYTSAAQALQLDLAAAGDPRAMSWMVEGAAHVMAYIHQPEEYLRQLLVFFASALRAPKPSAMRELDAARAAGIDAGSRGGFQGAPRPRE